MKKRYLILESGRVFEGVGFGADPSPDGTVGELVFTTGMCGYLECITDPSYYGQIVTQTFPMIGNYGVISSDFEGCPALFGYVVREWCPAPSNFRSEGDIDAFLKERGIPGISGVDTREITKLIRDRGVMNAVITDGEPEFSLYSSALSSYAVRYFDATESLPRRRGREISGRPHRLRRESGHNRGASSARMLRFIRSRQH